ncbi:hypothetical protein Oter_0588 [Opitutus terrae PB90-1]|uniref:Uncharacterized protein n=1 Tax=Opitutus terrae (strain DSM 11246 / JCM 15787 / PB90-1) TaxID=452637 RepID=B1ZSM1_OPITP|nr:hypothetical protein Oter_0588 [Opitutus terrae PB90-1]
MADLRRLNPRGLVSDASRMAAPHCRRTRLAECVARCHAPLWQRRNA